MSPPHPRPVDARRGEVYAAERMVLGLFDNVGSTRTVQVGGATITLPTEARFGSLDSVRDYIVKVLALPAVRERFPGARNPARVRLRRGATAATYERVDGIGVIAIPESADGAWALRELVVLHELAHHLDESGGPSHGRDFRVGLTELVGLILGPEVSFAYRVIFGESGLWDARPT